jgi:ApbE superfamily uncharacterized protein (UPF0280 family)
MIQIKPNNLIKQEYSIKESRGVIISDKIDAITVALNTLLETRSKLNQFCEAHPTFLHSLEPVNIKEGPKVAKLMADYASMANVGPMAAVAGVLSDMAVQKMKKQGTQVAIVENGGEAYFHSNRYINITLQAGSISLSKFMGFQLQKFPIGVGTSSGRYSHALSLGNSDAVTIFAINSGLADAAATATANIVKGKNPKREIKNAIKFGLSISGVQGVIAIIDEHVGMGGIIPPIIEITK